jgi:hypothetical protein
MVLFCSVSSFAGTQNEVIDVTPGGKLTIQTDVGSIYIKTHNQPTIELSVSVDGDNAEDFSFEHKVSDGDVTVIGEIDSSHRWVRNLRVKFELTVPKQYNVDIDTSGGSLSIEDIIGNVEARTSGGSINVGSITGEVRLNTSGGSINTETVSGNLDAHTSGGSINVTIDKQLTEDAKLTTSGGSITAYLMEDIQIELNASTSGGRVKSDFEVNGRVKKQSIKGDINGGGPKLTLKTSGGSVRIKTI